MQLVGGVRRISAGPFLFGAFVLGLGCTSHRVKLEPTHHTVEVEPIYLTIDVNIRVQQELDSFFEEVEQPKDSEKEKEGGA